MSITVKLMKRALENIREENTIFFLTPDGKGYQVDYVHLDLLNNRIDLTTADKPKD